MKHLSNSHLVQFNQPKIGIVNGFVEEIHGMLIANYSEGEYIGTVRTLLVGEELAPSWHLNTTDEQDNVLHFFKSKTLDEKDMRAIVTQALSNGDLKSPFDTLTKLGYTHNLKSDTLKMKIYKMNNQLQTWSDEFFRIDITGAWIPQALNKFYSIQSFLGRQIILESDGDGTVDEDIITWMNQILENQLKYGVMGFTSKEVAHVINDGVNTYCINGITTPMTREEFLQKYPKAWDERE